MSDPSMKLLVPGNVSVSPPCSDVRVQRHLARVYSTLLVASALAAAGCYAHIVGVLSHGILTQVRLP